MINSKKIAIVIPCFRVERSICKVIKETPSWIDHIYTIDDCCPNGSGLLVEKTLTDQRIHVIYNKINQGVGGAVVEGYKAAIGSGCDIIVKIDGDGQMDIRYLYRLIEPIIDGRADYTKGNRLTDLTALRKMPIIRKIGNFGLTILTKFCSGHWHIADPVNGYTALHRNALQLLNFNKMSKRYFFETSLLIQLNIIQATVVDVPMPARYGDEISSLNPWKMLAEFPLRLLKGLLERIFWRYFIYDISAVSIFLTLGMAFLLFGTSFGVYKWAIGAASNAVQTPGTVALSFLPIILGFQMLLQAMLLDIIQNPIAPLSKAFSQETDDHFSAIKQENGN
jgi:glycosyltransferase involved in cell wall biosynthesis